MLPLHTMQCISTLANSICILTTVTKYLYHCKQYLYHYKQYLYPDHCDKVMPFQTPPPSKPLPLGTSSNATVSLTLALAQFSSILFLAHFPVSSGSPPTLPRLSIAFIPTQAGTALIHSMLSLCSRNIYIYIVVIRRIVHGSIESTPLSPFILGWAGTSYR